MMGPCQGEELLASYERLLHVVTLNCDISDESMQKALQVTRKFYIISL
jgi:hypothetical protein